jgi:hypothetical protein
MAGKNKGGRESRKPKQEQNKKKKGQTPSATGVNEVMKPQSRAGRSPSTS